MSDDAIRLLKFATRFPDWSPFSVDADCVDSLEELEGLELIEIDRSGDSIHYFRLDSLGE